MRIYTIINDTLVSAECKLVETGDPEYIRVKITKSDTPYFMVGSFYSVVKDWRLSAKEVVQDRLREYASDYNNAIELVNNCIQHINKIKALL
jgi:prefoldin subunit 5